jgi:uncharacterized membrane protein
MQELIIAQVKQLSPELATVIVAMLPIFELRGAIPLALGLKLSIKQAYLWAVLGNIIPVVPLLLFLGPVSQYLCRFAIWERFFNWLFARTRRRSELVERLELIGLVLFVAVPLPITGAWTGTVAAFLFDIPFKHALPAIILGVMIAGVVVTLASLGVIHVWSL